MFDLTAKRALVTGASVASGDHRARVTSQSAFANSQERDQDALERPCW